MVNHHLYLTTPSLVPAMSSQQMATTASPSLCNSVVKTSTAKCDIYFFFFSSVGVKPVTFSNWEKIDSLEMSRGEASGKPREKLLTVEEMLQVARK